MARRFIFSQMFDVRPRKNSGELDLEKIKKIEALLNLKIVELMPLSQRIINLKPRFKKIEILNEEPQEENEAEEILETAGDNQGSKIEQLRSISGNESMQDLLEISLPDQSEIFSILEAIESADQLFKEKKQEQIVAIKIEQPEISERSEIFAESESAKEAIITEEIIPEAIEKEEAEQDFELSAETQFLEVKAQENIYEIPAEIYQAPSEPLFNQNQVGRTRLISSIPIFEEPLPQELISAKKNLTPAQEDLFRPRIWPAKRQEIFRPRLSPRIFNRKKSLVAFLTAAFFIFSIIPVISWVNRVLSVKDEALNSSLAAYQSLVLAKDSLLQANFSQAEKNFGNASYLFASASTEINQTGKWLIFILENTPGLSFFSSRIHLIKAGEELSKAGQNFTQILNLFGKNQISFSDSSQIQGSSLAFNQVDGYLRSAISSLIYANSHLAEVNVSSLPQNIQGQLAELKEKLPEAIKLATLALGWSGNFSEISGYNQPKKYLLIFQNNAELRPTGGFIGTYGVLDLDQGQIKKLFIDGIFNADGQLMEKIIPPKPIQKISTAWSMHDANWFADWPASAQKIMLFFEKTGGPTTDGIISLTPTVVEKLLALTGPIELPEFNVVLNAENFAELTQYKVEVDYDKELNQPKKILADFAPKFIEKIGQEISKNNIEVFKIISQCLKEKHILIYFTQPDLEELIKAQGWAGEIKNTDKDYFSIVHTNINGYKTDRVIEEKISHIAQIQEDGSVIDTLQITRHHNGGKSQYEWYNKVNADYLRVYLPKGTELISASGQTQEVVQPPVDYEKLAFGKDPDVVAQEQNLKIDQQSGTQIFEESDKTVFGNWVYVSPGETVTITYQYRLPFKLNISKENISFGTLAQKQSGTIGSDLQMRIIFPESWQILQSNTQNLKTDIGSVELETDLSVDRLTEFVFKP